MTLTLRLHTAPDVPLEAESIGPDRLDGLTAIEVAKQPALHGNESVCVGDFFEVSGSGARSLQLEGDLSRIKYIGAGMSSGRIQVEGNLGPHVGAAMSGGEIEVNGHVGDWLGSEMTGGRIVVNGDAGHMVGSAPRGARVGIRGGEILIRGNAGNEVGNGMRRGLIAIEGDCGDFAGVNMLAGTIIVVGQLGWRSGAGMKRGSIVSMCDAELLPTFAYACRYNPVFLRLLLLHLQERHFPIRDAHVAGCYRRYSGDGVELNRGEVLLYDA